LLDSSFLKNKWLDIDPEVTVPLKNFGRSRQKNSGAPPSTLIDALTCPLIFNVSVYPSKNET